MDISPLNRDTSATLGVGAAPSAGRSPAFASALAGQMGKYEEARTAAEQLVATTFLVPLLKQVRSTNNAAPPFAPTNAEKSLRALADTNLAESIVHKSRWPLVEELAQRMLKKSGQAAGPTVNTGGESST